MRATPVCSSGPRWGATTAQSPNPAKGRKSPGPKYCFPTREMERSRNDQVPIFISTLRSPQRYSIMKPMKLMPPKLSPSRTSSGPGPLARAAAEAVGMIRATANTMALKEEKGRMVGEQYDGFLPGGQNAEVPDRIEDWNRGVFSFARVLALGVSLILPLAACMRGEDRPPPLPESLLDFLGATHVEVLPSGPGLAFYGLRNPSEPWAVYLLRVELNRCELRLKVLEAPVSEGAGEGRSQVSELLARAGDGGWAAVNGDFFTPEGRPVGTEVVGGIIRQVRSRPAFAWRPLDNPWVGTPAVNEDSILVLGWELSRLIGDERTEVVGGFPLLLIDGGRVGDLEVSERPSFAAERHPRTAVGFDSDGDVLWVVVVDGRQPDHSVGMTLPELASVMEALGVEDAVNLDGGGSSVMVVGGTTISSPSDLEGERPVVNALGVLRDSVFCRAHLGFPGFPGPTHLPEEPLIVR